MGKLDNIEKLKSKLAQTKTVIIGAGAGLSTAAGFYPYETWEEYWAYWSRYTKDKNNDDAGFYLANEYIKMCIYT